MKPRIRRKKILQVRTEMTLCWLAHFMGLILNPSPSRIMRAAMDGFRIDSNLYRRLDKLTIDGYLESCDDFGEKIYQMSEKGRLIALGGIDPTLYWNSRWDGKWRVLCFDLPEKRRWLRAHLRSILREHHFGRLQRSLWLTPHPLGPELLDNGIEVESLRGLVVIEGDFRDKARHEDIVGEAWDWENIRELYQEHEKFLKSLPLRGSPPHKLMQWMEEEFMRWKRIATQDPFLPRSLWPTHYLGEKIWKQRLAALSALGQRTKKTPPLSSRISKK